MGLKKVGTFLCKLDTETESEQEESLLISVEDGEPVSFSLCEDKTRETNKVEVIPYSTKFDKRIKGVVDTSILQNATVMIIGLGSGGSDCAEGLLRSGVTNLILMDFDTVGLSNLCRSRYDLADVGRKKTEALHEKLLKINPCANIQLFDEDILEMDYEKLMELINASDLILEATDNIKTKRLINGLAYHTTPVIYPAVYESGKGGDILFTYPSSPCFECVFQSIIPQINDLKKAGWDYTTGQPKSMPGLLADIQIVVARTVKLALALLLGDQEDSLLEKVTVPGCTFLLIGNEKNVSIFEEPFQESWMEMKIDPECFCQTLG